MIYVSKSSLQRWEKSYVPENKDVLNTIASVFGMTVDDLREQSCEKYGNDMADGLSPEQRAEVKYGVNRLIFLITIVCILGISTLVIPLFVNCLGGIF